MQLRIFFANSVYDEGICIDTLGRGVLEEVARYLIVLRDIRMRRGAAAAAAAAAARTMTHRRSIVRWEASRIRLPVSGWQTLPWIEISHLRALLAPSVELASFV